MLLAGEDTTANTMAWMMHFMCLHPQVQERMQREVDSVLSESEVLDDIKLADKLAFVDAVAMETMRLKPVAPVLFRRAERGRRRLRSACAKGHNDHDARRATTA
jgi:cytochrome P450